MATMGVMDCIETWSWVWKSQVFVGEFESNAVLMLAMSSEKLLIKRESGEYLYLSS